MANNKDVQRLATSNTIFKNLLSCSDEQTILEKEIDVYDHKELQNGWQAVTSNAKYVTCETERRVAERTSPCMKSDLSKKRKKKDKEKENHERFCNYNKCHSLGVLSYGVPSWRTIIDPKTCTYIQRVHPCLYNAATGHIVNDLQGLSFVDPAGILDRHLGGFVQRQRMRNVLEPSFDSNYGAVQNDGILKTNSDVEINKVKPRPLGLCQMPLSDLKPLMEPKAESWLGNMATNDVPKSQTLMLLPMTSSEDSQTSSVRTKTLPPVRKQKIPTIDRKTDPFHREILHSQKIKLLPFKQPFTPVNFQVVQRNRKQNQKLNWLPITTTSQCLPRSTPAGQPAVRKPTWAKPMALQHDPINEATNHLKEQMEIKQ